MLPFVMYWSLLSVAGLVMGPNITRAAIVIATPITIVIILKFNKELSLLLIN